MGGSELKQMFDSYDYDRAHSYIVSAVNIDTWVTAGGASIPLMHLFGDVQAALQAHEKSCALIRRTIEQPDVPADEEFGLMMGLPATALFTYTSFPVHKREAILNLLVEYDFTWDA